MCWGVIKDSFIYLFISHDIFIIITNTRLYYKYIFKTIKRFFFKLCQLLTDEMLRADYTKNGTLDKIKKQIKITVPLFKSR